MPRVRVAVISDAPAALIEPIHREGAEILQVRPTDHDRLRALFETEPDAFVIDVRGASALPELVRTVRRANLDSGIVIITSRIDPSLLLEAMRAGVTEVVSEPFTAGDVAESVRRATSHRNEIVDLRQSLSRKRSKDVSGLDKALEYLKVLNR